MDEKILKKDITSSESNFLIENGKFKLKSRNIQSTINYIKKLYEFSIDNNLLKERKSVIRKNRNKFIEEIIFDLDSNYEFELGPNILWLIGKKFKDVKNKFIVSKRREIDNEFKKFIEETYEKLEIDEEDLQEFIQKFKSSEYYPSEEDNSYEKEQLFKSTYNLEHSEEYEWFSALYDRITPNSTLIFEFLKNKLILDIEFKMMINTPENDNLNSYPHNRIVFGAPGTGKSHKLNTDKIMFGDRFERVTFHPNYSYSQFVGTYKPVRRRNENNEPLDDITYKYVPGPFIRAYIEAYKSPNKPYLLLIEEINRANVTAVFGDIFQLLDRKNGESEFEIETTEDLRDFFHDKIKENILKKDFNCERMKIPKNLYIWATMNSADQGVFPMDTAFKRRWDFEYISIDEGVTDQYKRIKIKLPGCDKPILWNKLRTEINNKLSGDNVNEDKLLGPYFISKQILDNFDENYVVDEDEFKKAFENKVLMYLFEDAGKHCPRLFEKCSDKSKFSSILNDFREKGIGIFGFDSSEFEEED